MCYWICKAVLLQVAPMCRSAMFFAKPQVSEEAGQLGYTLLILSLVARGKCSIPLKLLSSVLHLYWLHWHIKIPSDSLLRVNDYIYIAMLYSLQLKLGHLF